MKVIFALLTILALSSLACADPTADSMSVSSGGGGPGATSVPVLVNITNTVDGPIQGIAFDVIYDNNVITLVKAKRGSDLPTDDGDPAWTVKLGTNNRSITMYTDDQGCALANGTTGNIVELQFDVTGTAGQTSPIELSNVDISSTGLVRGNISTINNGSFTVTGKPGDLNADDIITSADATMILQTVVHGDYDELADLNSDYSVTSLDALMLMQQLAADPTMTVTQQPTGLAVGDMFTAEVTVDPLYRAIYAAQYDLHFDPAILEAIEQKPGDFLSQSDDTQVVLYTINNTVGKIEYGETISGDTKDAGGATEPGVLASIIFKVIGEGTSSLTLSDVEYVEL